MNRVKITGKNSLRVISVDYVYLCLRLYVGTTYNVRAFVHSTYNLYFVYM